MGMFTSIIHPVDGRALQIKCGHDSCETYHIGDNVGQFIIPKLAGEGYLLDDVYDSCGDNGDDDWVVIKGGVVVAVEPRDPYDGEDEYLPVSRYDIATDKKISTEPLPPKPSQYQALRQKYDIQDHPRGAWSEEVWRAEEERERRAQLEAEEFRRSVAHLPPAQQFGAACANLLRQRRDYDGIARQIFKVEPLL